MALTLATVRINPCYWWWVVKAQRARSQGDYRRQTLHHFFRAWQLSGAIDDLLAYALFRRDLGYVLPKRWAGLLECETHHLKRNRQLLAIALLYESQGQCPEFLRSLLSEASPIHSPAILSCLHSSGVELAAKQSLLRRIQDQQSRWRDVFQTELLKRSAQSGVCVVGNAGNMRGALLGSVIDQCDYVVRFNTFSSAETNISDRGQKLDAWVITPGFQVATVPENFSGTVVLTGPDVRYRLLNWSGVSAVIDHDLPLLTVPLVVWRELVRELAAPPSAGILFLAWLKSLLGSWSGVSVAGFSALSDQEGSNYHYTDAKHRPSARHNWVGESVILQRWQKAGLTSLHG